MNFHRAKEYRFHVSKCTGRGGGTKKTNRRLTESSSDETSQYSISPRRNDASPMDSRLPQSSSDESTVKGHNTVKAGHKRKAVTIDEAVKKCRMEYSEVLNFLSDLVGSHLLDCLLTIRVDLYLTLGRYQPLLKFIESYRFYA